MMEKTKRILAILGVVAIVALYGVTFVSALLATPATQELFKASLLATLVIPILIYAYVLLYRVITGRQDGGRQGQGKPKDRGFDEAFGKKP